MKCPTALIFLHNENAKSPKQIYRAYILNETINPIIKDRQSVSKKNFWTKWYKITPIYHINLQ